MTPKQMWAAFSALQPQTTSYTAAFQFGVAADQLAQLVLCGEKTATSSAYPLYEASGEPLPQAGTYDIVLDSRNQAVCVIRTTKVTLVPFCQVSAQHAFKEGEGDKSFAHWRAVHEHVFRLWLAEAHLSFDQNMLVVCEEFDVVYAPDLATQD